MYVCPDCDAMLLDPECPHCGGVDEDPPIIMEP